MAGGYATRLWPITRSIAKPLLPIGNDRIIDLIVKKLRKLPNIDSIYVTSNAFYESQFRDWISENGYDVELIVEGTFREEEKLGTIRAMYEAFKGIGDEEYLVVGGDNVMSLDFASLLDFYAERNSPVLAVYEIDRLEDVKKYGEVTVGGDFKVLSIREKPSDPRSRLISTACYVFPKGTIDMLKEYIRSGGNVDSPGYFIEWLHKKTNVYAFPFTGYWFDIGTPDSYISAFKAVNRGIIKGNSVHLDEASLLEEPTFIGEGSSIMKGRLKGSYIGKNVTLENTQVDSSIILDNAEIRNARIYGSIIGGYARIEGLNLKGSVVGEYSKLSI